MEKFIIYAALFITFTTTLGSVFAIIFKRFPDWWLDVSLAFSGGIMLVASFTSLILPSIKIGNIWITSIGIILGFFIIYLIEKYIPHENILKNFSDDLYKDRVKHISLIITAIMIHNLPEGLAVGVSFVENIQSGIATTLAIGIQDIPEGLAISLPLMFLTKKLWFPLFVGILSGISEGIFAILGNFYFSHFQIFLPLGLSIAGSAMLFVTIKDVFPQVYKSNRENLISLGFLIGLLIMLILDSSL